MTPSFAGHSTNTAAPRDAVTARAHTMGIEEEFLLVGQDSGEPVARAGRVLSAASEEPRCAPDAALHPELLSSQVEAASGRCTTASGLRSQLTHARCQLGRAAHSQQAHLVSSGTPIMGGDTPPISEGDRFQRIAAVYSGMVADYQACGCHVHVGVADHETAVAVLNHLRPWLATLLALSANSPLYLGRDTGYASWRMVQQARFPGAGVPPYFASAADYDAQLARLVDCGALLDQDMSFWLARPSPRLPTVELRVADAAMTPDEAVLQAVLTRGLVRSALTELDAGREGPRVDDQIATAAVWSAARYGLGGVGVHPIDERRVAAVDLVGELLRRIGPALEDTGDLELVRTAVSELRRAGTGADRQRSASEAGSRAVVDMVAASTVPGAGC